MNLLKTIIGLMLNRETLTALILALLILGIIIFALNATTNFIYAGF